MVSAHRHLPEIEQELIKWYKEVRLTFTPHLVPLTRGMLSTIYLSTAVSLNKIQTVYQKYYKDEPFIKFYEDNYPEIKWVQGTNFCALGCSLEESKGRLIIISVIDNLIKGAAGQAIQNMNLMCGFWKRSVCLLQLFILKNIKVGDLDEICSFEKWWYYFSTRL